MKLTSNETYLIDSNVLVYAVDAESPYYTAAKSVIEEESAHFVAAQQNLLEFIAVLTRGYTVSRDDAVADARSFAGRFEIISPLPTTFQRFAQLMREVNEKRYPFDVYLAATMLDNHVSRIITANVVDFEGLGLAEIVDVSE